MLSSHNLASTIYTASVSQSVTVYYVISGSSWSFITQELNRSNSKILGFVIYIILHQNIKLGFILLRFEWRIYDPAKFAKMIFWCVWTGEYFIFSWAIGNWTCSCRAHQFCEDRFNVKNRLYKSIQVAIYNYQGIETITLLKLVNMKLTIERTALLLRSYSKVQ